MYLPLRTKLIYEFLDIMDCKRFLQSLPIGPGDQQTFVFAGLEASHAANHVLQQHALPEDRFVKYAIRSVRDEDSPNAVAFKVKYSPKLLEELLVAIKPGDNSTYFCAHIVGFLGEEPWFSFHDAFGGYMIVSGSCAESEVLRFASDNNTKWQVKINPWI